MIVPRGPLWRDGGLALGVTILLWWVATTTASMSPLAQVFWCCSLLIWGYAYWAERTQPDGATALHEKAESLEVTDTHLHDEQPIWRSLLVLFAGIIMIVLGGRWLVDGAVDLRV